MAALTLPYGFTVGKIPGIEERVRRFTLTRLQPTMAPLPDYATDYERAESMARHFLSLYGNADCTSRMKILSFDVLYAAINKACDMAVSSQRAAVGWDGVVTSADMDAYNFISAVKAMPVQYAIARIVRLLETCVQPDISLEFGNILTKHDIGTALHHLMVRVDAMGSHIINYETRLSSHQMYYVANELAAELCASNVIYGAPFLVSAMRSALENHEPVSPLETKTVRFPPKHPDPREINNKDKNASAVFLDIAKDRARQYVIAAADAWVREDYRDRAAANLVLDGYDRDVHYRRGPAYGGPPRLDGMRWAFWSDQLALLRMQVPAIYAAPYEAAVVNQNYNYQERWG